MKPAVSYLPNLTAMRGFAALMVVLFHFDVLAGQFVDPLQSMIIKKSYLMVDLFFVMSGFIILHVYGQEFTKKIQLSSFLKFAKARFARVYPLHVFTLLLLVAAYYAGGQRPSPINNPAAIPTHLLLLHACGIHSIYTWNIPSWSISAEWWAYMIFPICCLWLNQYKTVAVAAISILSVVVYIAIVYFLPRTDLPSSAAASAYLSLNITYDYGYLRGLAGFMTGLLAYKMYENQKLHSFFGKDTVGFFMIFCMLLMLHIGTNDLLYIPLFLLLVLSVSANQQTIYKICNIRLFQYLGNISYSIYLMHGIVIFLLIVPIIKKMGFAYKGPKTLIFSFGTGISICLLTFLLVILISSLTYYGIEKPFRRLINKKK
jgi:peptidoglycan/LPS O-acetylase OafA/YrhL